MNITSVRISLHNSDKLLAIASFVIDSSFVIKNVRITQSKDGDGIQKLYVNMPKGYSVAGDSFDVAHPINEPTRLMVEREILKEYFAVKNGYCKDPAHADFCTNAENTVSHLLKEMDSENIIEKNGGDENVSGTSKKYFGIQRLFHRKIHQ
jgi:DNA-binding cell septation regulator SpoVG